LVIEVGLVEQLQGLEIGVVLYQGLHLEAQGEDAVEEGEDVVLGEVLRSEAVGQELGVLDLVVAVLVDLLQDLLNLLGRQVLPRLLSPETVLAVLRKLALLAELVDLFVGVSELVYLDGAAVVLV